MIKRPNKGVETPDEESESPDRNRGGGRTSEIVLVEIAKLQGDGERLKSDVTEGRKDLRELRDRMIAIEVNVSHLPSKGFIITVVVIALTIAAGLISVAPKLQSWAAGASAATPAK